MPPALRYTGSAPAYQPLEYWWALVKDEWWAKLGPAEKAVMGSLYAHADVQEGLAWPSIDTLMQESGYGRRAVETARTSLAAEQQDRPALIELVKRGGGHRSSVYRLIRPIQIPTPPQPRALYPAATCGAPPQPRAGEVPTEETQEAAPGCATATPGDGGRGLFDGPAPVERAAAAAFISLGLEPRRARGLVTEYRPTAEQAANIAANVNAKQARSRRGQSDAIRDVYAFVRSLCREGSYALDDGVAEQRRRAEVQTKRLAEAEKQAREAERQRQQTIQRKQEEQATWDTFTDTQKLELRQIALDRLPGLSRPFQAKLSNDHPMMRGLILAEYAQQQKKARKHHA